MRILLISPYFYPHPGGSQRYIEELHYHLLKKHKNVSVDVLCYNTDRAKSNETYRNFRINRVSCHEILPGQFALPKPLDLIKTVYRLTSKNNYDLVVANTRFFESAWWTPLLAKLIHAKSILIDHCAFHPVHASGLIADIAVIIDKIVSPLTARFYDEVIVTNKATMKFDRDLMKLNPRIVYGGVDSNIFGGDNNSKNLKPLNIKPPIKKNDIVVTFLGRMIPSKGPELVYKAAEHIIKHRSNVRFIFAGPGPVYENLKLQNIKKINLLGALNVEKVSELLSKTDIVVHPSTHHEGFPNVILEAGASGCAVIATDKGGTTEIIKNGKTGIIIKPDRKSVEKALNYLIKNKLKRKQLGQDLKIFIAKKFNWSQSVDAYWSILSVLVPYSNFSVPSR